VYRTLHSHFFGADKVNTMMRNNILSFLKSKIYQGDCKNVNFDKYCLAHVADLTRCKTLTKTINCSYNSNIQAPSNNKFVLFLVFKFY